VLLFGMVRIVLNLVKSIDVTYTLKSIGFDVRSTFISLKEMATVGKLEPV